MSTLTTGSAISADGNLGVYIDSSCTNEVTSLDWSTLSPGGSTSRTVYVKNHGETDSVLGIDSDNWIPSIASNYLSLSWDREGHVLDSNMVVQATITLSASQDTTGVDTFSFRTLINAVQDDVIIIDDVDASLKGTWRKGSYSGFYGVGFLYNYAGSGRDSATWSFMVPKTGVYEVYVYWVSGNRRATNAPYRINGVLPTVVRVNQKANGEEWVSLGKHDFLTGAASIVLSDDADEIVVADAVKLVYSGEIPMNTDPVVSWIRAWGASRRLDPGGRIARGDSVRLYTRVYDLEDSPSEMTVFITIISPSGVKIRRSANYYASRNYWYIDWVIPTRAELGLYDVNVELHDTFYAYDEKIDSGEFKIVRKR